MSFSWPEPQVSTSDNVAALGQLPPEAKSCFKLDMQFGRQEMWKEFHSGAVMRSHSEMFPWSVPADLHSVTVQGTCKTEQTESSEGVKPWNSSPESLGYFCPWKYSRICYKGLWAVLFPGWEKSINFEGRSNLELGPALSEGLMRWPVGVLFKVNYSMIQARSSAKQFLFLCFCFPPWLSLALPFCLVKEVCHWTALSCPPWGRPWPAPQGALTAVVSL